MDGSAESVLHAALELPAEARAAIIGRLIESLDEEVDAAAEEAWADEIARRVDELDRGEVQPIPWAVARRMILGSADDRA